MFCHGLGSWRHLTVFAPHLVRGACSTIVLSKGHFGWSASSSPFCKKEVQQPEGTGNPTGAVRLAMDLSQGDEFMVRFLRTGGQINDFLQLLVGQEAQVRIFAVNVSIALNTLENTPLQEGESKKRNTCDHHQGSIELSKSPFKNSAFDGIHKKNSIIYSLQLLRKTLHTWVAASCLMCQVGLLNMSRSTGCWPRSQQGVEGKDARQSRWGHRWPQELIDHLRLSTVRKEQLRMADNGWW